MSGHEGPIDQWLVGEQRERPLPGEAWPEEPPPDPWPDEDPFDRQLLELEARAAAERQARKEDATAPAPAPLRFLSMAELEDAVAAEGPPRWLLRRLWPSAAYGVVSAEMKAGKSWLASDLAVAVAAGGKWLGMIDVDEPGPVLMFAGEGGQRNILRRLRAVAEYHEATVRDLPIVVCARVPHLSKAEHLAVVAEQIARLRPKLVILDPLYLAARGAQSSQLYEMGAVLEEIQHLCEPAGAALVVITHHNRNKDAKGAARITGAGPAEWGRVLLSSTVQSKETVDANLTRAVIELDAIGGEIADQTVRFVREVWSDDPDDLGAPLRYTIEEDVTPDSPANGPQLPPAVAKVLESLELDPAESSVLVDRVVAKHGHGLKRETVSRALNRLEKAGLAVSLPLGPGRATLWSRPDNSDNSGVTGGVTNP